MANFYYGRIKRGKSTIENVPEKWRAEVQALIDAETAE